MNWNAPEIEVTIGDRTRIGTVKAMEINAARSQPVTSLYMELSNIRFEWQALSASRQSPAASLFLRWGYRGQELTPLFDGTVLRAHLRETLKVWGLCRARALMDTHVTRTYQDEEAEAIVEHLVGNLGFVSLDIAECETVLDKLPLHDSTIIEAIHYLNRRLNLDHAFWCDAQGGFHWGPRDDAQEPMASFTHGEDIIDFRSLPGDRFLLTAMGAPVWHSRTVSVIDRDGSEKNYFVEQVRHTAGISGSGSRSHLWLEPVLREIEGEVDDA